MRFISINRRKKVKPTGRIIDMTRRRWGHNFEIMNWWSYPADSFHGFVWATPAVKEGDVMRWQTPYGFADGLIYNCTPTTNVGDMYTVDVTVVHRDFSNDAD